MHHGDFGKRRLKNKLILILRTLAPLAVILWSLPGFSEHHREPTTKRRKVGSRLPTSKPPHFSIGRDEITLKDESGAPHQVSLAYESDREPGFSLVVYNGRKQAPFNRGLTAEEIAELFEAINTLPETERKAAITRLTLQIEGSIEWLDSLSAATRQPTYPFLFDKEQVKLVADGGSSHEVSAAYDSRLGKEGFSLVISNGRKEPPYNRPLNPGETGKLFKALALLNEQEKKLALDRLFGHVERANGFGAWFQQLKQTRP